MTTNTTRRAFLGASALLAAGTIIHPTPTLPHIDADLHARLAAILNRPLAAQVHARQHTHCRCADCDAARATPFNCLACGFQGEPTVFPCECGEQWDEWTSTNAATLRSPTISGEDRKSVAAFQRRLLRAGRPPICPPSDVKCAHLARTCPICGVCEGGDAADAFDLTEIVGIGPAGIIRDLRAALNL